MYLFLLVNVNAKRSYYVDSTILLKKHNIENNEKHNDG